MRIHNLEDRITQLLTHAHERKDSATDIEYQQTFEEEGVRKSQYIVDDLRSREERGELTTSKLIYLCIGGADGSEVEHVLRNTGISQALMVEISDQAAEAARERAKGLLAETGKSMRVIEGDVTGKLEDVVDKLVDCKREFSLNGIVCSAQAVLHELPKRSPGFDFSIFFGKIYEDPTWETVAFYSREPCRPHAWPEEVQINISGVSGDLLRRFALHVAGRLGLPQKAINIANNWVQVPGILAVELVHKLLRNDTIRKINYELEEQLTSFEPSFIEKILKDHVPGIKIRVDPITTEGFRSAIELHDVQFRDNKHNPLPTPLTHVRIIAIRTNRPHTDTPITSSTDGLKSRPTTASVIYAPVSPEYEVHSNLGAPSYSRFIRRDKQFAEIVEGLRERKTPVLVTGISGVGKTSLAHEVATHCIEGKSNCPHFDAVVWISDKANPGFTSLNTVLDEIARTLDYAGLAQLELLEKRRRVEDLARSKRILIVVDSFETITDQDLFPWLCNLPEPSKAIVTTTKRDQSFPDSVTEVHVPGMNQQETRDFVEHRLTRLGLRVTNYSNLTPLLNITQGNAKAIEIALGIIKRKKRPLAEVVESLAKAEPPFDDFCSGAWSLLDKDARIVLLATHYFPFGTQDGPLMRVSQIEGTTFERAVDLLSDLGQLDLVQNDLESPPIYSTHGLVSAFVGARINDDLVTQTLLRRNWLEYLKEVVAEIGFCWDDISRLLILDDTSLRQTVLLAIERSFEHQEYDSTIAIARDVRYYFYVRGFWAANINLHRAEAAQHIGDLEEEFAALTYHLNIASKQRNLEGIEPHLLRLKELAQLKEMSPENNIGYHHALALFSLAKGEYDKAEKIWISNLASIVPEEFPHEYSANTRWLAVCYEKQNRIDEAHELLDQALEHAQSIRFTRGVIDITLKQATLYIRAGDFDKAANKLRLIESLINEVQDRCYEAQYSYIEGRINDVGGRTLQAEQLYAKALDAFERLGMNDRAAETKVALDSVRLRLREDS